MSVADARSPQATHAPRHAALGGADRRLSGWGRAAWSRGRVIAASTPDEVAEILAHPAARRAGVIARGAGRSYGDAAQSAGGVVIDLRPMDRAPRIDAAAMTVSVPPGLTYAQLLSALAAREFIAPVIPGTRHVTMGGAIASDVHGKNHPHDGAIARHVRALTLCTPADGVRVLDAQLDRELVLATVGGMGLTGVVVEATIAIEPLPAPWFAMDTDRTRSLEETIALMARDEGHRYSVAWLDMLARRSRLGRAVVTRSHDAPAGAARDGTPELSDLTAPPRLRVPRGFPGAVLAPPLIAAFNELRWRAFPSCERARPVALSKHFFPLDGFGEWNRLYGGRGLLQYQFVVPDGEEETLIRAVELLHVRRIPSYLGVLKRMGGRSGGPLSFPLPGWTLALDIPTWAAGLGPTLDAIDELVAAAGGRVYLTKDGRLRRDAFEAMYPELGRFRELRAAADPDGVLRSDLGARLGLCRAAA
jgi:decaprenylphospho-beta-D-ribofuranose 2-oxidase